MATAFKPTPPDASALILRVIRSGHSGQFSIENGPGSLGGEFDRYYVHLSGYCGQHNPGVFAAAPELLQALELALEYWADREQRYRNRAPRWVKEARAAIAKARQTGASDNAGARP